MLGKTDDIRPAVMQLINKEIAVTRPKTNDSDQIVAASSTTSAVTKPIIDADCNSFLRVDGWLYPVDKARNDADELKD